MQTTTKITSLLYTEEGAKIQMAKTPGVKDVQKNWLLVNKDYATNGQMGAIVSEIAKLIEMVSEGETFNKKDPEYSWSPWTYGTPDGGTAGIYIEVLDKDKAIVPQLEEDITRQLTGLATSSGFVITSDNRNVLPKLYQQIDIKKLTA